MDVTVPTQRLELARHHGALLVVVAVGGVLGAEARYGVGRAIPSSSAGMPWAVLLVNISGSLLLGLLMAWLAANPGAHRLVRPLLGAGVIGGYTTFSTYAEQTRALLAAGHPATALAYVALTLVLGLLAAGVGGAVGSAVFDSHRSRSRGDR